MPSLADKLKSLGVKVGTSELPPPKEDGRHEIGSVLPGTPFLTSAGETFIHEERFGADYLHGHAPIRLAASLDVMSAWASEPRLRELPLEAFAFLDTETSG